jgi:hypothetical protein
MAESFSKAFAAARKAKGAGGVFTWQGKKYTTDYAEDKKPTAKTPTPAPSKPKVDAAASMAARNSGMGSTEKKPAAKAPTPAPSRSSGDAAASMASRNGGMGSAPKPSKPKKGYTAGSSKPAQSRGYAKGGKTKGKKR